MDYEPFQISRRVRNLISYSLFLFLALITGWQGYVLTGTSRREKEANRQLVEAEWRLGLTCKAARAGAWIWEIRDTVIGDTDVVFSKQDHVWYSDVFIESA